ESPQRRDGERDHQEPEGPVARRIGDVVNGIGTQTTVERVPYKQRHGAKAEQEHQRFENPPAIKFWHSQTFKILEILSHVPTDVELCQVVGVAIERQRRPTEELTDAAFRFLTPPWMINLRIHVRVEAVLAR